MSLSFNDLLKECTVKLITCTQSKNWGTGFFCSQDLIITCTHVVKNIDIDEVIVYYQNQNYGKAKIDELAKDIDLAVLKFQLSGERKIHQYLPMDKNFSPNTQLFIYGYGDDLDEGSPVTAECEGEGREKGCMLIKFKGGQIRPGHSGSPILNKETEKICGIVNFTRNRTTDLGGYGVPVSEIEKYFPEVWEQNQKYERKLQSLINRAEKHCNWISFIQSREDSRHPTGGLRHNQAEIKLNTRYCISINLQQSSGYFLLLNRSLNKQVYSLYPSLGFGQSNKVKNQKIWLPQEDAEYVDITYNEQGQEEFIGIWLSLNITLPWKDQECIPILKPKEIESLFNQLETFQHKVFYKNFKVI